MDSRVRLLRAVDEVLAEVGPAALSLRAVARRAGVSHNLPGVLFGDKRGLLTAYAAEGLRELGRAMAEAEADACPGPDALAATGRAYVRFALASPERFALMFRQDQLRADDPDYLDACREGFAPLARVMRRAVGSDPAIGRDVGTAAWAMVHGLAMLQIGGHLPARTGGVEPEALTARITALFAQRMAGS
ncbi:MAG: TetR/AcrR family transcriptional regulator [Alphaproteobacteria bacterium]|nr:TetR/AcrR family transcriptional regulator [Alphaproteobacteria bacterium]